ncbi:hypothetical protein [Evansella tamaricis]|uniref:Uncharacterized protein n=1 Tax=Evansella tamaricis TaxID=2069301 RepID=A0ABS6JIZ1_9BACI|nr:hypothetical protein [Evansella tamaricis]MBU9713169.1 hypothetical protein [Evansella tamaricis]
MSILKNITKEHYIVFGIFVVSILVGILVGGNREWFRPAFSNAGYMAGSLMTCLILFSIYHAVSHFSNKKPENDNTTGE